MRHQRQGEKECLLTTIAMLADCPLDRARRIAAIYAGSKQWNATNWPTTNYLCAVLKVRLPTTEIHEGCRAAIGGIGNRSTFPAKLPEGRGTILLWYAEAVPPHGHIVAYEDGIVYDPSEGNPMAYHVWREGAKWNGATLVRIDSV